MLDPEILYGTNLVIVDSLMHEKKCYNALTVAKALEQFVDENFRGLSEIDIDLPDDAVLFISVESFAMFIKEIFNFVFGRALLKVKFFTVGEKMLMHITSTPSLDCSMVEASRFVGLARDIGFDLQKYDEKTLTLHLLEGL